MGHRRQPRIKNACRRKDESHMEKKLTVSQLEKMFSMQIEFMNAIRNLIVYDEEHAEIPEKTKWLEGFCDTQEKALDVAIRILNKHKQSLLVKEEESLRKKEEAKKEKEDKAKAERKKIEEEKAKTEEGSLFEGLE